MAAKPLIFINSTKRELGQFKALQRKLRADYDVLINKEDLSSRTVDQCSVLVLGASRDKFSKKEVDVMWEFLEKGGNMMVLLGEGGEPRLGTNINYFLEHYGIVINPDCVISSTYTGQVHPKDAVVSDGVLNREFATAAQNRNDNPTDSAAAKKLAQTNPIAVFSQMGAKSEISNSISIIYPYGATLEVQKPAVPVFSSGRFCFPMSRPIIACVSSKSGKGRLVVCGSYLLLEDLYLIKEDNQLLASILFDYLLRPSFVLNKVDADAPDIQDDHPLPDTLALSDRVRVCLKETDRVPIDYTTLFDTNLFAFNLSALPDVISSYTTLSLPHQPLTLIPPEFEVPLPPLKFAVFPPQFRDLPKPRLELFDLEEEFASVQNNLAQAVNKCGDSLDDLEDLVLAAGNILGINQILAEAIASLAAPGAGGAGPGASAAALSTTTTSIASSSPVQARMMGERKLFASNRVDAKMVLEYIFRQILQFRCSNPFMFAGY